MANSRQSNIFAEPVSEEEEVVATPAPAPGSDMKRARVHGSWAMYWGNKVYNFEDGKTYTLPIDLFEHLKKHGNIYDTL